MTYPQYEFIGISWFAKDLGWLGWGTLGLIGIIKLCQGAIEDNEKKAQTGWSLLKGALYAYIAGEFIVAFHLLKCLGIKFGMWE